MATHNSLAALVKSVLSGDTLVLRGKVVQADALPREKVLHLADLTAPRIGSRDRDDEPWAFESRDFLRSLVVGKEVSFSVSYTLPTTTPPLEFGIVYAANPDGTELDVAAELVRAGWAKVRDSARRDQANGDDEEGAATASRRAFLRDLEEEARIVGRGLWSSDRPPQRRIDYLMPEDPVAFLAEHKGKPIDAIVEGVTNGSQVRARLLLSPEHHQMINLGIAGVRAPRSGNLSGREDVQGEEFGDEARFFVESRLLQRLIKITLLSLPTPTPAPGSAQSAAPQQVNLFLGTVHHPAGNIAALLMSVGLARIVDWHAGFLASSPTPTMMSELRRGEAEARANRRGLYKDAQPAGPSAAALKGFNATCVRVWGADMLSIVKDGDPAERRVQLASVRQPRPTDPKVAGLQLEGKEALRKRLVGKPVNVVIDYVKPAEGEYEARECATVRLPNGTNVAEYLVERGLLGVLRHKQGDANRSSDYDRLMAAEARAIEDGKGIHSGKDVPAPRIVDASESAHKAAPFLSQFKRQGRIPAVVDYVASGSRFKIWIPKQDTKLTLVLSQIRAPRTARNANEKSEPYGQEAATLSSRRLLQRDVEFQVDATDKSGGFIGRLFYNGQDVATMLVREGLAKVDEYSNAKELWAAQEAAQKERKNLWSNYDPAQEAAASSAALQPAQARKEYVDVVVSEVRGGTETVPFSFSVQLLQNGSIPELEKLMLELTVFHKEADVTPAGFAPRSGELVSAQFSVDNAWYRAKVRRSSPAKKEAEVVYIDYGNTETLPFSRLRPLAAQFKTLEGQAKDATLSFVSLLDWRTEYGADAMDRFRELCEGQQLVANIDAREPNGTLSLSLFDPNDPNALASHENSLNCQLVGEGLARIDRRSRLRPAYPDVCKRLEEMKREASRGRYGAYEMGDILEDD
ncbi:uncharacterized protein JCM10292_003121 [Rhodotorula paludigena]|uniref:uncharacterized protein n=1 Tax=Rhodotorula paludigena TaxID=86838 RepID=UPI00317D699B